MRNSNERRRQPLLKQNGNQMPRRLMFPITLISACLLFVDRLPAQTEIPPDAFSRHLEKALGGFTRIEKKLINDFPRSDLAHELSYLIYGIKIDLLDYDDQLRQQSLPRDERVAKLRELCIEKMKRLHLMKPDEDSRVEYNERNFQIMFTHKEKKKKTTSVTTLIVPLASQLNSFLDLNAGLDPVARELSAALSDFNAIYWHYFSNCWSMILCKFIL